MIFILAFHFNQSPPHTHTHNRHPARQRDVGCTRLRQHASAPPARGRGNPGAPAGLLPGDGAVLRPELPRHHGRGEGHAQDCGVLRQQGLYVCTCICGCADFAQRFLLKTPITHAHPATHPSAQDRPLLVLGGGDDRLHQAPVLYTSILGRGDTYLVGIASAAVGGVPLPVAPESAALVDTGSSLAFLPEGVLAAMAQALPEAQRSIFDATWDAPLALNATELATLPTLTLALPGGAVLALEGSDYLQPLGQADPATALPLHYFALRPARRPDFFLLGQVVLRKLYTEFDAGNGRVGFAPAVPDCYRAAGL